MLRKGGQPVMRNGEPVTLDYVTARFVMDRLDAAVGPANWTDQYECLPNGAVRVASASARPASDEWVTKWDVGVPSSIEPDKGAHSDAFKRAAVQVGHRARPVRRPRCRPGARGSGAADPAGQPDQAAGAGQQCASRAS